MRPLERRLMPGEKIVHRARLHPLYAPAWPAFLSSEFAVTDRRLLIRRGWLRTKTSEVLLSKLGSVGVEQTLRGRLLGFGTVLVKGPGGAQEVLSGVRDPVGFSRALQHQMSLLERKPA